MDGADPDWGSVVLGMHMGGGEVDPYWSNVSLLMLMNGTNGSTAIGDVTGKTVTVAGNTAIVATQSRFGGYSCYFDGSGDYISMPSNADLSFETGDFTIEAWVNLSASPAVYAGICDRRSGATLSSYAFAIYNSGGLKVDFVYPGARLTGAINLSTGVWNHVAVTRTGGVIRLFVNGVVESGTATYSRAIDSSNQMLVGAVVDPYYLNGYIDDFRITKGVARYTADFTPPREPFSLT